MSDDLVVYAVGDIAPDREDPGSLFLQVEQVLNQGDVVFGQLEAVLSEQGTPLPQARLVCRSKPQVAHALGEAGFDVISFASNHCMDLGREAFYDTLAVLNQAGLAVVGAGRNIAQARQPAIIERKGTRIAFLAYNSILPQAYWAEADRPGCVPLRAFTVYEQIEHDQPGTPCRVHTYPKREDVKAMVEDIRQAKSHADIVIVSIHWGIHFIPAVIADYQRDVAHAAIDAGADLILGHHAHILKGVEVYRGKAIFFSLCNFAIDLAAPKELLNRPRHQEIAKLNPDWVPDPEYPTYFMPKDSRKTIIVKCVISKRQVQRVSFLPTYINPQSQPQVLNDNDPRFNQVLQYIKDISHQQQLECEFLVEGNEVIIHADQA